MAPQKSPFLETEGVGTPNHPPLNPSLFTDTLYKKSALSLHIYKDHPEYVNKKLLNYSLGIIKSTAGLNLDRTEDYYVESLRADLSLNRYKVTT